MDLDAVEFLINENGILDKDTEELLIKTYRNMLIELYGYDAYEAFLKVTKSKETKPINKTIEKEAKHYQKAINILESIQNNNNDNLIMINIKNKLIGFGRLIKNNNKEAIVSDFAFIDLDIKQKKEIWQKLLKFMEEYLFDLKFSKLYVKIPYNEVGMLSRAINLGYLENPEDIDEEGKTYLLNKILEGKK